jgi:hypothetical protein
MGNISAVLEINGRSWIPGLKPLSNVGINVTRTIEKYLIEANEKIEFSNVTFELEVFNKYNDKIIVVNHISKNNNKSLHIIDSLIEHSMINTAHLNYMEIFSKQVNRPFSYDGHYSEDVHKLTGQNLLGLL